MGPYPARKASGRVADSDDNPRSHAARLDEAIGLAGAIDLQVVEAIPVLLSTLRPATYIGKGKVEELSERVKLEEIGLVVMDCALSPVQQRNLEKAFGCKVIDRTGLILEIFGRRARTREGTLQVELAHLNYQKSRLVRSWTHLERQRGGFGFLGGPGETQIEADRRVIQERMTKIERDLETVKRTRSLHRASRKRVPYPIVALVGYTNAGKSTLFNRLTSAEVLAQDMLFATLDPTARALKLPHGAKIMLSDTVGFISDLPTQLVAAFRATLEDAIEADVLLHVRDVSHEDTQAQATDVRGILRDLGIDPDDGQRVIEVWNKADLLESAERERQAALAELKPEATRPVLVSALTGEGMGRLTDAIEARIARSRPVYRLALEPGDGKSLAWLHANGEILERSDAEDGALSLLVRLPPEREGAFTARFPQAERQR
ncbi:MAG TPA: GTPase HflX [Bosea sp. (in: a-proteobacteria)]|nr:GTPase HflX [Bosea sp. (in: a-proteobacteria)]